MREILPTTLRLTLGTAARMHCWDVETRFTPEEQNHPPIIPAGFRACCLSALAARLCFGTQQSGSFRERTDCPGLFHSHGDGTIWLDSTFGPHCAHSSVSGPFATDTNQELRNIPAKGRYEKARHIEM